MLVIRLFRIGKKKQPSFKIVVTDKRRPPKGGRFVQEVGFYNPLTKEKILRAERIKYWLSVGAKPSDTVHNLLIKEKIITGKKIPIHPVRGQQDVVKAQGKQTSNEVHKIKKTEEKPTSEQPVKETP